MSSSLTPSSENQQGFKGSKGLRLTKQNKEKAEFQDFDQIGSSAFVKSGRKARRWPRMTIWGVDLWNGSQGDVESNPGAEGREDRARRSSSRVVPEEAMRSHHELECPSYQGSPNLPENFTLPRMW